MKFSVFTHVEHERKNDHYFAYAPYVREMNIWFPHFENVEIVAPLKENIKNDNGREYVGDIKFISVPSFNLLTIKQWLLALIKIPKVFFGVYSRMEKSDHIHLRCPGNIGLIACIVQIFFPGKPKTAKYAGNWDPDSRQPWTYRLQKWILKSPFLTKNMQVLVYGDWPKQTKNIKSFFTASFPEQEKEKVKVKDFKKPFTFLFVGNLVNGKQTIAAIQIVERIAHSLKKELDNLTSGKNYPCYLEIFGDGPERERLEEYSRIKGLEDLVIFHGNRNLEEVKKAYRRAHFVILPSKSEGWPKAIAEGMFFGCIPIATPVSCVPWMLGFGSRGILLKIDEHKENFKAQKDSIPSYLYDLTNLLDLLNRPEEMQRMSEEAKEWSQQYTLEEFQKAIKKLIQKPKQQNSLIGKT